MPATQTNTNNNYQLNLPVKWDINAALAEVNIPIAQYAGEIISGSTGGGGGCGCEALAQDFDCNCIDC